MSGTHTHGNIFYKPAIGAKGAATKATFDAALDKTARIVASSMGHGVLVNGKISATITPSNVLQVEVQTLGNTTPTTSNPVWCRVGTRVVTITSALTLTRTSTALSTGDTGYSSSWLNLAKGVTSGNEVDLFTYIGWSTSKSIPFIAVSRVGWHTRFSFVSEATDHGALCSLATGFGGSFPVASQDEIAVCSRFAVTLTTPNTWSTPASGSLIINRPTDTTRLLNFNPEFSAPYNATVTTIAGIAPNLRYQLTGDSTRIITTVYLKYTASSTRSYYIAMELPIPAQDTGLSSNQPFGTCYNVSASPTNRAFTYSGLFDVDTLWILQSSGTSRMSYWAGTLAVGGQFVYTTSSRERAEQQ